MGSAIALRGFAQQLRAELSARNRQYAEARKIGVFSRGEPPVVLYEPAEDGLSHGNFHPKSYRAIVAHPEWRKRLEKHHAQAREALARNLRPHWNELDSSCSSDALLMNIFCHPKTLKDGRVLLLLGEDSGGEPQFGFKARVPLSEGRTDRTEIDMRLGNLLVEAKLTESDFQRRSCEVLGNYRDFEEVFDRRALPRCDAEYYGYQLIRNVLAAHALDCSFCLLLDARRPDLLEQWYAVMRCVKSGELRTRMGVLTWQELAAVLPTDLREFLEAKYGI